MTSNPQRRSVVYYVATVVSAAWLWMLSFKLGFRPPEWVAITVLMFIPGLVSLAFRLAGKEGFGDVGWSLGKMPYWGWAFFGPLGLAVLSFFAAGLSGKATLALRLS